MPASVVVRGWRSDHGGVGYDLTALSRRVMRAADSFSAERARGRVNHAARDQALTHWWATIRNEAEDSHIHRIHRILSARRARLAALNTDPEVRPLHQACARDERSRRCGPIQIRRDCWSGSPQIASTRSRA
jgi:hypothetical protein